MMMIDFGWRKYVHLLSGEPILLRVEVIEEKWSEVIKQDGKWSFGLIIICIKFEQRDVLQGSRAFGYWIIARI